MKIALHKNSNTFFESWKEYCEEKKISFKVVNCYDSNIVVQLKDCDILFFHHNHASPKDVLFAKQLLFSLETGGKIVFPEFYSNWHFDDKLGQKYLFESLDVDHVPTHAFYDKKQALEWVEKTDFPKVFKLRRGAGSRNVWLVKSKSEAKKTIATAFGKGFRQYDSFGAIKENIRKFKIGKGSINEIAKAIAHIVVPIQLEKTQGRERGYVYFQDFIPNNTFDIRVVVIGNKAFAIKRHTRKNDFRASGSGFIEYKKELFDDSLIKISFDNANKLNAYCTAFDYVFLDGKPLIVEISYGFNKKGYYDCPGYWTKDLIWHEESFNPYGWMIEDKTEEYNNKL